MNAPLRHITLRRDRVADLRDELAARAAADPARAPWPDDWFTEDDGSAARRCRALWGAVFAAKMTSALRDRLERQNGRKYYTAARNTTFGHVHADWIGSRDFMGICELLDLDGEQVAAAVDRETHCAAATDALLQRLRDGRYSAAASRGAGLRHEQRQEG